MKPIKIKDYQEFCLVPSGSSSVVYNETIGNLMGLNMSGMTSSEVEKKVGEWIEKLVMSKTIHDHVRLGKTWYVIDRDLYDLVFTQWIHFHNQMRGLEKNEVNEKMHTIIATFLRPCRVYKFLPKKFSPKDVDKISMLVREHMDIEIGLELINFFFRYLMTSLQNTKIEYLGQLEREAWEKVQD